MNISGLVVRAAPGRSAEVRAALEAMPGVEVRAVSDAGQLVVVAEHPDTAAAADGHVAMHGIEGVLSVSLVYQRSEDAGLSEES